jgi:hypothetical protein
METTRNDKFRVHIWVKGRVQGVGFRSHVEYNALQIGVLGWVRNLGWMTPWKPLQKAQSFKLTSSFKW